MAPANEPVSFVRIASSKGSQGFLVLAARDFDPAVHQLYEDPVAAQATAKVAPAPAAPTPASLESRDDDPFGSYAGDDDVDEMGVPEKKGRRRR